MSRLFVRVCVFIQRQQSSVCPRRRRDRDKRLVGCQHLVTNDAAALSSANWPDRDGSGPCTLLCLLAAVCVCVCVLTVCAHSCCQALHCNSSQELWGNTVRRKETAQTSLYRLCNTTSASNLVFTCSSPLLQTIWEDNKSLTRAFMKLLKASLSASCRIFLQKRRTNKPQ